MNKLKYLIENKKYSIDYIKKLGFTKKNIELLLIERVCRKFEDSDKINFKFVGIISNNKITASILPKYCNPNSDESLKLNQTIQMIKVLKKYALNVDHETEEYNYLTNNIEDDLVSEIALADFILRDYLSYGLYVKSKNEILLNDIGETYWEDTVNLISPYIVNNKPYYFNTYNLTNRDDLYGYMTRIHKWAVRLCMDKYSEILGYNIILGDDFDEDLSHIGPLELIISLLQKEIHSEYNDRNIRLFKSIKALISKKYLSTNKDFSLFGKTHFEHVWEEICSKVIGNEYSYYKKYIPSPKWTSYGMEIESAYTLKPDLLKTVEVNDNKIFFIMDAKYYNIQFAKDELINAPGINDISKQIFYLEILKPVLKDFRVANIFLFPKELNGDFEEVFGDVNLQISESNLITLMYLDTSKLYDMYINSQVVSDEYLHQLIETKEIHTYSL